MSNDITDETISIQNYNILQELGWITSPKLQQRLTKKERLKQTYHTNCIRCIRHILFFISE